MKFGSQTFANLSLAFVLVFSLCTLYFFKWNGTSENFRAVNGDGRDYYSFLVAAFIDHDLSKPQPELSQSVETPTGNVNTHTIGVSLLLLPFFLIGMLSAKMFGFSINGLSEPFQISVSIGALFYCLLGLIFLRKLLIKNNFADKTIAAILLFVFAGTNLLFYTLGESSMSHVYSFFLVTCFLYSSNMFFESGQRNYFFKMTFLLSLIILVRPVNSIIVLFLPFFCNSFSEFFAKLKSVFLSVKTLLPSLLILITVLSLQSLLWYKQNGKILQDTYKGNGFYFTNPSPIKMLFGFDSGLFIYSPLCLLLLVGLIYVFKQSHFKFFVSAFFILFTVYLFSSYWAYNYYDSFGMRPFVDFFAVFAIAGAFLLRDSGKRILKPVLYSLFSLSTILSLIYSYQAQKGIFTMTGMNSEKFSYVFLKTGKEYEGCLGGSSDIKPYSLKDQASFYNYENLFSDSTSSKKGYFEFNKTEWGPGYYLDKLGFNSKLLYTKIKFKRQEVKPNSSFNGLLVCSVESKTKEPKCYQTYRMNETPSASCCEWKEYEYAVTMAGNFIADDKVNIFFWNKEKTDFNVDDLKIEIYKE
ncbi:MAG: hypothetical protein IAF38_14705 [Bacteroidia bacterium]|nr:hypothetical protein [Bacteroidia bacterium]